MEKPKKMGYDIARIDPIQDFTALPIEAVTLSDDHITRAIEVSQLALNCDRQWHVYLQMLALLGFEQWLLQRDRKLCHRSDRCTTLQPAYANLLNGVCNLQVGEFSLCLVVMGSLTDTQVAVPRAALELPEFSADFFVLVEVVEEQEQVSIMGCLPRELLSQHQESRELKPNTDWTYSVPISWFDSHPNELLLWLRYLNTKSTPHSVVSSERKSSASELKAELMQIIPQIQYTDMELWQVLSWEKAAGMLRNFELVNWCYHASKKTNLTQKSINTGLWLRNKLDELADSLSWVLLPPLSNGLRIIADDVEAIIEELKDKGMEMPSQARGAYKDLTMAGEELRLYAYVWSVLEPGYEPEWKLLIILGSGPNKPLKSTVKLLVRDLSHLLVEDFLKPEHKQTYLYARVVGNQAEQFWVTVQLDNDSDGSSVNLFPFRFDPDEVFL